MATLNRFISAAMQNPMFWFLFIAIILLLFPDLAHASSTSNPWEKPLDVAVRSITGPVAAGLSLLAIVAAGVTLMFGGELTGFIKTLAYLALVISFIVLASPVLLSMFGVSTAVIG